MVYPYVMFVQNLLNSWTLIKMELAKEYVSISYQHGWHGFSSLSDPDVLELSTLGTSSIELDRTIIFKFETGINKCSIGPIPVNINKS